MTGNKKVIEVLNQMLAEELTAINQYVVHAEMCDNWGYERLHKAIEKEAIDEMKHAEKLIARILFLEGIPIVSQLNEVHIGATVPDMLKNDLAGELGAVRDYNKAVAICSENADAGSRELFEHILMDEEKHVDFLEAQLDQISQYGLENYLVRQVEG